MREQYTKGHTSHANYTEKCLFLMLTYSTNGLWTNRRKLARYSVSLQKLCGLGAVCVCVCVIHRRVSTVWWCLLVGFGGFVAQSWSVFLNVMVGYLILSAALQLFILVDGVVEFSRLERFHGVLVLLVLVFVFVFISSSLTCRTLRRTLLTHPQHLVCLLCCCWLCLACVLRELSCVWF